MARGSDWALRPHYHEPRTRWWQHFTDLAILKRNIVAESTALRNLVGGNKFDAALPSDAILLQWRLNLMIAQTTENAAQKQIQMFLNYPAEARLQLLKIGRFLCAKIENHVKLAPMAECWARFEVHLAEVGPPEETESVE